MATIVDLISIGTPIMLLVGYVALFVTARIQHERLVEELKQRIGR